MTSTSPYVSYPSNIQPSHEASSALQLAWLMEVIKGTAVWTVKKHARRSRHASGAVRNTDL